MGIDPVLLVGLLCAGVGLLLCFGAIVMRQRVYAARGTLLLVVGFVTMFVPSQARGVGGWLWHENDRLVTTLRERAEIERSLHLNVLPLIARCESDLQRVENASPSSDGEEQQRIAAEKSNIRAILEEARQRQREHEQALAELGTAIGGLQREQELTRVKQVEHGRAMARVTFSELGSKTEGVLAERRAR